MRQNVARQNANPRKSKGLFSGQGIGRKASILGGRVFKNVAVEIKFKYFGFGQRREQTLVVLALPSALARECFSGAAAKIFQSLLRQRSLAEMGLSSDGEGAWIRNFFYG